MYGAAISRSDVWSRKPPVRRACRTGRSPQNELGDKVTNVGRCHHCRVAWCGGQPESVTTRPASEVGRGAPRVLRALTTFGAATARRKKPGPPQEPGTWCEEPFKFCLHHRPAAERCCTHHDRGQTTRAAAVFEGTESMPGVSFTLYNLRLGHIHNSALGQCPTVRACLEKRVTSMPVLEVIRSAYTHLMPSFDELLIRPLDLDVHLETKPFQLLRFADVHLRVDYRLLCHLRLAELTGHELHGTQEASFDAYLRQ